ncbi:hypothetical protein CYMTET_9214 [Cymbomonas tetramitiformis]|uniref:Reverse transcriptase domain-containing protein n=1 Tax=Cymbomonas tetramitiformis TaxID=36881 RepID=A0AAE0GT79_9CHLO|nr:hypothetical protein CYMTET_9214 [Cymbomonas tetramitiformis]
MPNGGWGEKVKHTCFDHNTAEGCKQAKYRFHHKGAQGALRVDDCQEGCKDGDSREPGAVGDDPSVPTEKSGWWWAQLEQLAVAPVWDAQGTPWPAAPGEVPGVPPGANGGGAEYLEEAQSGSLRWLALRREIVQRAQAAGRAGTGTTEVERMRFQREVRGVRAQVPLISERAHLLAVALKDWAVVAFLVRGAACGVGFPFADKEPSEPYVVTNYMGSEHEAAMAAEIAKELAAESSTRAAFFHAESRLWAWWSGSVSLFGNRALPGIFMRYTRAIVGSMQSQGVPCVGYLHDLFMVAGMAEEAQGHMDLLIEFATMLGFKAIWAKCEGPAKRDFYPFTSKAKTHINCLELFAQCGGPAVWAHKREGWMLVVCIDNQCALYTVADDARRQRFEGLNTWANLPFSVMYEILVNFLRYKRRRQMGTGACFLMPV